MQDDPIVEEVRRVREAESFSLTETHEDELLAAMAEIERGEYATLEELLQSLPKHGPAPGRRGTTQT